MKKYIMLMLLLCTAATAQEKIFVQRWFSLEMNQKFDGRFNPPGNVNYILDVSRPKKKSQSGGRITLSGMITLKDQPGSLCSFAWFPTGESGRFACKQGYLTVKFVKTKVETASTSVTQVIEFNLYDKQGRLEETFNLPTVWKELYPINNATPSRH